MAIRLFIAMMAVALAPLATAQDFDEDGILDAVDNCEFESNFAQDDFDGDGEGDACSDLDEDGLTDELEFYYGLHPDNSDTDCDFLPDGAEVGIRIFDPLLEDTDGDGLTDMQETLQLSFVYPNINVLPTFDRLGLVALTAALVGVAIARARGHS